MLEGLPWHPDVMRVDIGATGPVALTGLYLMDEDLLAVDTTGRLVCLSRRDLNAKWVSTLQVPARVRAHREFDPLRFRRARQRGRILDPDLHAPQRRRVRSFAHPSAVLGLDGRGGDAEHGVRRFARLAARQQDLRGGQSRRRLDRLGLPHGGPRARRRRCSRSSGEAVILTSEDNSVISLPVEPRDVELRQAPLGGVHVRREPLPRRR